MQHLHTPIYVNDIVRRWSTLPEAMDKVNKGVKLTRSEFNTIRAQMRKMNYREDPCESEFYVEYRKARDLVDRIGFTEDPWYALCDDGYIASTDRELLVNIMYNCYVDEEMLYDLVQDGKLEISNQKLYREITKVAKDVKRNRRAA